LTSKQIHFLVQASGIYTQTAESRDHMAGIPTL